MNELVLAAAQAVSVRGDVEANVQHHCRLAELAASRRAAVVVFPELSLTGYELDLAEKLAFSASDERLRPLQEVARSTGTLIVAGAPVRLGSCLHIGAFVLAATKEPRLYTKRHLYGGEASVFEPGTLDPSIEIGGAVAALAICADTSHPTHAAAAAERGAELYLAGVFFSPEGFPANEERLSGYAQRHSMVVAMANAGAATSRFESAGGSAIWSESGARVARFEGLGAGLAIARKSNGGWVGETRPLRPRRTSGPALRGTAVRPP